MSKACVFCRVIAKEISAAVVAETDDFLVFLDHRPLFVGHCLVVPKQHHETLLELPEALDVSLWPLARRVARALEASLEAKGTFVAMNNRVSQSVPHLHVHVVPRRPKDGLKGFFWPRTKYDSDDAMHATAATIRAALP